MQCFSQADLLLQVTVFYCVDIVNRLFFSIGIVLRVSILIGSFFLVAALLCFLGQCLEAREIKGPNDLTDPSHENNNVYER